MRTNRRFVLGAALVAMAMFAAACGSGGDETPSSTASGTGGQATSAAPKGPVIVGVSAAFAENQIVAEMYAQVLENAGFEVERSLDLGSREVSEPALESGQIDIKPEYLGSLLLYYDPDATASANANDNVAQLRQHLTDNGIGILNPSSANDTNVFVVTQATADEFSLAAVSDLAAVAGDMTLGGPPECPERPFCIPGLEATYGVTFKEFKPLDVGGPLTVAALESGDVDVALLFSTDANIGAKGFVSLEDDGDLQQNESITPVVRQEILDTFPEIGDLLNSVSAVLDTETMITLNGKVQIDQEDPADVAQEFLTEQGLIGS
jgi:osmoprotectant transport system substrate-binding protein